MPKADLIPKSMDIAARSIDLLTALTETADSPHSLVQVGIELGRWLGREKLSESQLRFCLEKARGLVIANSQGNTFYEAVVAGTRKRAVGPLFVQPAGSLGRLMAKDPYLCWVTSTIACLFEFHREDYITDVLCCFIMQTHMTKDGKPLREFELAWHPLRLQLKPVLEKIVSSIWYNVVNSGVVKSGEFGSPTSLPLPPSLRSICPRGHNIESHKLGVILSQLQTVQGEIIIESDNMISNLTLWLVYHFKGRLRVIVSGKIMYDHILGPEESTIEHRTREFCGSGGPCGSETVTRKVKVYASVAGNLKKIFTGDYDSPITQEQSSRTRQKLYQPVKYPPGAAGKDSIRVLARQTGFAIVKWLLNLRVQREAETSEVSFTVLLNGSEAGAAEEDLRVNDILARVPSIMNMGWGEVRAAVVVFSVPVRDQNSEEADDEESDDEESDDDDAEMDLEDDDSDIPNGGYSEATPENILQHFPILRDFMHEVAKSCLCYHCRSLKPLEISTLPKLKPGCLKHTAFMEVMTYIAHSVSEAFGADDCSASVTQNMTDWGVLHILRDVIGGSMRWKSWLNTAARVVLGCSSIMELTDIKLSEQYSRGNNIVNAELLNSTVVAVQHGNIAVVAPWLDISQPLSIKNCFGFKLVQGRLGIVAGDGSQFQSLQGDLAVIETRHTEDVQNYVDKFPLAAKEVGSQVGLQHDNSSTKSDFILIPAGSCLYKLLMRVISDSHSRLLDPARAMIKTIQPTMPISCTHPINQMIELQASAPTLRLYTYDEILGRWPDAKKMDMDNIFNARRDWNLAPIRDESEDEGEGFPTGQYHQAPTTHGTARDPNASPPLRVSQILDSCLKFNTTLALVYNDITILNHETACLACILEKGVGMETMNGVEGWDPNRWVVCRKRDLDANLYGDDHQRRDTRKRIKAAV